MSEFKTFEDTSVLRDFSALSRKEFEALLRDYRSIPESDLIEWINRLRVERNAVILAHNYQELEVQNTADYIGDSLGLSIEATKSDASIIVFCGVDFMAESAKILNPDKKVIIPDNRADCPMARMVSAAGLRKMKLLYPDAVVVTYVNSTADVKAESDICCTSANAVEVVKSLGDKKIIFAPDKNLALYVEKMTGADIIPWEGFCYVHNSFSARDVNVALEEYPGALFIAHPEAPMDVLDRADLITSTSGMVKWVEENTDIIAERGVIIGTEVGLVNQVLAKHPGARIYPLFDKAICRTQKMIDLPKICWALENEQFEVEIDEAIRIRAYSSLKRMIDIVP